MIQGALEVNEGLFINWNKAIRIDFVDRDDGRHVYVRFEKDEEVLDYGVISSNHEKYVKRQLRGEGERREAGFGV